MQLLTKVRRNLSENMVILLFAGLALLSSACSSAPDTAVVSSASTSKKEIIYEFNETLSQSVLPDRNKFFNQWGVGLLWSADVEPTEYEGQWKIRVPQGNHIEEWEFNMPHLAAPYVTPRNGSALLTAILFFCADHSDPKPSCQSYVNTADRLLSQ